MASEHDVRAWVRDEMKNVEADRRNNYEFWKHKSDLIFSIVVSTFIFLGAISIPAYLLFRNTDMEICAKSCNKKMLKWTEAAWVDKEYRPESCECDTNNKG